MATGVAMMKPGAVGMDMSMMPPGPPEVNCQTDTTPAPVIIAATAPQKLNLRQYRDRIVTGPKAAPIPPQAKATRLNIESGYSIAN